MQFKTIIEPFRIKTVERIRLTTPEQREEYLQHAHFNPFLLHSDQVIIDLLTDSGTSAMSSAQWAGIMRGDESYAGASSWLRMEKAVQDLTGCPYILPTHQGRAAEHLLYTRIGGAGKVFISNTHFDTTRANIEFSGATAIDCPIHENSDPALLHPFKGNLDTVKLQENIEKYGPENVAAVVLTVTNNSGGGQPVSMDNARQVSEICKKYGIRFILDACRIAENAWFVKHREPGFENTTYREIAQQMFGLADGCIMSAKKDALVNMGGFLALRDLDLAVQCRTVLIITEGYSTYGGLSGRDMEAIAIGLEEVFEPDYLHYRIKSTEYLAENLHSLGIPIMRPAGGHAVYIDARAFYPDIPLDQYPGQVMVCELYRLAGIRCCEIGSVMFGKYDASGQLIPATMDLVRLAIPRRVYTQSHIDYVIETFEELRKHRAKASGFRITYEPPFLRHFTAHFATI
ncbi:MAG: tryptophanase [Saprospiraceae bacterium]|nr:tryptophanase [Saprospiraceae bacterium]